jgi:hypothetical protein
VVDNAANLHALDQKTGQALWTHTWDHRPAAPYWPTASSSDRGERERAHRRAGADRREDPAREHIAMPEGRHAEIWGSVAVAYGRLYFTAEDGLYCVGRKGRAVQGDGRAAPRPRRRPAAGAAPRQLVIVPGEVIGTAGRARSPSRPGSFDDKGRFLRKETATWSARRLAGEIAATGT